jgi:hypothetical protein
MELSKYRKIVNALMQAVHEVGIEDVDLLIETAMHYGGTWKITKEEFQDAINIPLVWFLRIPTEVKLSGGSMELKVVEGSPQLDIKTNVTKLDNNETIADNNQTMIGNDFIDSFSRKSPRPPLLNPNTGEYEFWDEESQGYK